MTHLDHLVVAATTLAEGLRYVQDTLGLELPPAGGKHPLMGTHNRLLNLGKGAYLEVIAVDPEAPPPAQPRWFNLDGFSGAPRLHTWVARTESLERYQGLERQTRPIESTASTSVRGGLAPVGLELGPAREARRGDLHWRIALPEDGRLHWGGVVPYLIQWGQKHPCDTLPDVGCRLLELVLLHPQPDLVRAVLRVLEFNWGKVRLEFASSPKLMAFIKTPGGLKLLR